MVEVDDEPKIIMSAALKQKLQLSLIDLEIKYNSIEDYKVKLNITKRKTLLLRLLKEYN